MPDVNELTRRFNDLSGEHMALRAAFESHREHCGKDKGDMKDELKAINGKLWAGLVLILFQLLGAVSYLVVKGTPWVQQIEVAGR